MLFIFVYAFHFCRFLSKCGDFFDYFISSHLKRIEFNPNFPVVEFFVLFYKYTFKQPETDSLCVCLVTWGVFLDHLLLSNETKNMSGPAKNNIDRFEVNTLCLKNVAPIFTVYSVYIIVCNFAVILVFWKMMSAVYKILFVVKIFGPNIVIPCRSLWYIVHMIIKSQLHVYFYVQV